MLEEKKGYITITYRLRFYDKHFNWLCETRILYNKVVEHYYNLLTDFPEKLVLSNFHLMRELEIMTIGTKEMKKAGKEAAYPLTDLPVIPLYFRRAAINCAISMIRSFQTRKYQAKESKYFGNFPSAAEHFSAAPVYYKGMYKELKEDSVLLKVYTGEKWKWGCYHFTGRNLPKEAELLSPTIYTEAKEAYLHIPVRSAVEDVRTVKERMQSEGKILAVAFPGSDSIAVGAILTKTGHLEKVNFFQGGLELKAKRTRLKKKWKIQKEKGNLGEKYLEKIANLNTYYAHLISSRILDFCQKEGIKIIVIPNYQRAIDFSNKNYLKTDGFEWIGRRIIRYLKYKSFAKGILVSAVPTYHISNSCSECGAKIKRYNEGHTPGRNYLGGKLFLCPNGHQGNSGLNTAKNIGRKFLSYYQEEKYMEESYCK